jgi:hypothetical protein
MQHAYVISIGWFLGLCTFENTYFSWWTCLQLKQFTSVGSEPHVPLAKCLPILSCWWHVSIQHAEHSYKISDDFFQMAETVGIVFVDWCFQYSPQIKCREFKLSDEMTGGHSEVWAICTGWCVCMGPLESLPTYNTSLQLSLNHLV